MAEIVSGLFGVNPQQLAQQRQATDAANAFRYAQLDPLEQAKMSIYQGGAGLGRVASNLLGGDPEMQKVSAIKSLSNQFDLSSATGMRDFARSLQQQYPQEAMMAAKRADEMETSRMALETSGLNLQKTKAGIAATELKAGQEEKLRAELAALGPNATEQDVINIVTKYGSPDKILEILSRKQDRKDARAAAAANKSEKPPKPLSAGLQKDEIKDLEAIDTYTAQSNALAPSIANLTANAQGVRKLNLSPVNNAKYIAQNALGNSTEESRAYEGLKSAVDTAVNLQVSAEKGVQTDKDVLRFAQALIAAYGRNDSQATLEALKRYNTAVETAKTKTTSRIESRRKSQGVEPLFGGEQSAPQSKEVEFNTLPTRNK